MTAESWIITEPSDQRGLGWAFRLAATWPLGTQVKSLVHWEAECHVRKQLMRYITNKLILCCIFLSTHIGAQEVRQPPWPMPLGVDHVWINHYPMAYQQHGRGEAVVLVHGSMGDYRTWIAQVPELSRHYRVFNLSLPRY